MKKKYTEATDVAKEQYLEMERQKEQYDQLQVGILTNNEVSVMFLLVCTYLSKSFGMGTVQCV